MLRVYLQTTPATELSLKPVYPNGGEFFFHGSAQLIHWTSMVPPPATATVDIDFSSTGSLGPFTNIVTNAPNSGTYQWHIPVVSSSNCYLKFTIDDGTNTYVTTTAVPFCIDTCNLVTGITTNAVAPGLIVSPNPSEGLFLISSNIPTEKIEVYNLMGKLVYFTESGQSSVLVDLSAFPAGLYLVNAISREGILRKEIVKLR
jgi:hypothetical protein